MKPTWREISGKGQMIKGNGTILLVDDEDLLLQPNAEILDGLGYRVLIAASGFRQ